MSGPLLEFNCHFWVAGATKREGFVAVAKTMASVGRLKRIWTTLQLQLQLHYTTTTTTLVIMMAIAIEIGIAIATATAIAIAMDR